MIRLSPIPNGAHQIHWFEWGEEPFQAAQNQNKPLMLFLHAFWCRICQRMDEEAFSHDENIALVNAYFVSVRAENAKRPDVDLRYNQNGWPTIVFMTPTGEMLATANGLDTEAFGSLLVRVYAGYQKMQNEATRNEGAVPRASHETVAQPHRGGSGDDRVSEITRLIMGLADGAHGGYGRGQRFIHSDANEFLLSRFGATNNSDYLDHVCLTLDRMRESPIHDHEEGGYYRTSSGEDWSGPHREKLLADQAGILRDCLGVFQITKNPIYARMAEGIIDYLNNRLLDSYSGTYFGCEDFIRREDQDTSSRRGYFSILDDCVYTDTNAETIGVYLEAHSVLGRSACKEIALKALEFIWDKCRSPEGGVYHYFDGTPHVPGLLNDQARVGAALVQAWRATGETKYLERAKELAEFMLARLRNPDGGYYDLSVPGPAYLRYPLTLIEQNGAAASFFSALAKSTGEANYQDAAHWALGPFTGDFSQYGIHAAGFGRALAEFVKGP